MTQQALNISKIASYITGTFAALGILWGVFKFVDTVNRDHAAFEQIAVKIDSLSSQIDGVAAQGYRLGREFIEVKHDIGTITESLDKTQKSYARYLMRDNTLTKEEFYKYMEGLTIENKVSWQDTLKTKIVIRKKQ